MTRANQCEKLYIWEFMWLYASHGVSLYFKIDTFTMNSALVQKFLAEWKKILEQEIFEVFKNSTINNYNLFSRETKNWNKFINLLVNA